MPVRVLDRVDMEEGQIALAEGDEVPAGAQVGLRVHGASALRNGEAQLGLPARPDGRGVEAHVVAAVAAGGGRGRGQRAQIRGAVHPQVAGQRGRLAAMGEVGEEAVRARVGQPHRRGPHAVVVLARVQVLEAGQVAPGDDQVHALRVLHVEVADGPATAVDDAEAQRLGAVAAQLGGVDDQAQAVLGDRQAAHRIGGPVAGARLRCAGALRTVGGGGLVALGIDEAAGQRARAEQQREHRGEAGEPGGDGHAVTAS
jgi:hypothetical protein